MKKYLGVKLIEAEPCTHGEYAREKYGEDNSIHTTEFSMQNKESEGYKVKYDNDYVSWSPKEVFEKAYFPLAEAQRPNSISFEDVDKFIKEVKSIQHGDKTTVTIVTLVNGFEIFESSACVDPANFDMQMGEQICLERAKNRIWNLLGFLLQCGVGGMK